MVKKMEEKRIIPATPPHPLPIHLSIDGTGIVMARKMACAKGFCGLLWFDDWFDDDGDHS